MAEDEYTQHMLKIVVAKVCKAVGWSAIEPSALAIVVDLLHKFLKNLTYDSAEMVFHVSGGLTRTPTIGIVWRMLEQKRYNFAEMTDFLNAFKGLPVLLPRVVPKYPLAVENGDVACITHLIMPSPLRKLKKRSRPSTSGKKTTVERSPQWIKWRRRAGQVVFDEATARATDAAWIRDLAETIVCDIVLELEEKPVSPIKAVRVRRRLELIKKGTDSNENMLRNDE